jgi:uncharacterized membrane protein YgdD (TMEM256/DUF423 family)
VYNKLLGTAGIFGLLAVALGAFGAHELQNMLLPNEKAVFDTASRYHFYHTLALVFVVILYSRDESRMLRLAAYAFIDGIVLFSGSLYLLSTKNILGIASWSFLGPITPVGGLFFLIGWSILAWYGFRYASVQRFRKKLEKTDARLLDEP